MSTRISPDFQCARRTDVFGGREDLLVERYGMPIDRQEEKEYRATKDGCRHNSSTEEIIWPPIGEKGGDYGADSDEQYGPCEYEFTSPVFLRTMFRQLIELYIWVWCYPFSIKVHFPTPFFQAPRGEVVAQVLRLAFCKVRATSSPKSLFMCDFRTLALPYALAKRTSRLVYISVLFVSTVVVCQSSYPFTCCWKNAAAPIMEALSVV